MQGSDCQPHIYFPLQQPCISAPRAEKMPIVRALFFSSPARAVYDFEWSRMQNNSLSSLRQAMNASSYSPPAPTKNHDHARLAADSCCILFIHPRIPESLNLLITRPPAPPLDRSSCKIVRQKLLEWTRRLHSQSFDETPARPHRPNATQSH